MNKEIRRHVNPLKSFGLFLIATGLMLMAATLDVLGWGGIREYFRWEMLLVFISLVMFLNLNFTGGVIFLAVGGWFLLPEVFPESPELVSVGYWPSVLVLLGLSFILPSPRKWCGRNINNC